LLLKSSQDDGSGNDEQQHGSTSRRIGRQRWGPVVDYRLTDQFEKTIKGIELNQSAEAAAFNPFRRINNGRGIEHYLETDLRQGLRVVKKYVGEAGNDSQGPDEHKQQ